MPFESDLGNMPVIDDQSAKHFIDPTVGGHKRYCALKPRDTQRYPYGGTGFAAMKQFKTQSKEWVIDRIEQREKAKSGLKHKLDVLGIPCKDQDGTNYCWIYSPVHAMEIAYGVQGDAYRALSATAAGTMITGGQNRGGYGAEAIDFLSSNGTCFQDEWQEYAQNPRLWTPEIEQGAHLNRITDWGELPAYDLDQAAMCLLHNFPITIGLSWWGHQVTLIDLVVLSGQQIGFVFDNSWGDWGDNGRGVLTPDKARGDMFYPISVNPRKAA